MNWNKNQWRGEEIIKRVVTRIQALTLSLRQLIILTRHLLEPAKLERREETEGVLERERERAFSVLQDLVMRIIHLAYSSWDMDDYTWHIWSSKNDTLSWLSLTMASYYHCNVRLLHSQSPNDLHLDCNPNQVHAMTCLMDVLIHRMSLAPEVMSLASTAPCLRSRIKQGKTGSVKDHLYAHQFKWENRCHVSKA